MLRSRVVVWVLLGGLGGVACGTPPVLPAPPAPASVPPVPVRSVEPPPVVVAQTSTLDPRDAAPMPEAVAAEVAFVEADTVLGPAALGEKALSDRALLTPGALARLSATAVDEDKILGWILGMTPACEVPEGQRSDGPCRVPSAMSGHRGRELYRRAIAAAGALGSLRAARIFGRLQAARVIDTNEALGLLLRRRHALRPIAKACPPPSAEQITAEEKRLDDFVVLEDTPKGLRGRELTATERSDLAYFFVSIGAAHTREKSTPRDVSTPSLEADRKAQLSAIGEGDLERARKIARASFAAWGLSKPPAEGGDGVPKAALASFAFDAGWVFELLGDDVEAGQAYRASLGVSGKSMDRPLFGQLDREEAVLRADDAIGSCVNPVWPRLRRGFHRPLPEVGTARLKANGFDVVRLYRGGLLTAHREYAPEPKALRGLTAAQKASYDARAQRFGPENFDQRGRFLQGWADEQGAAAIQPLLATARDKRKGPDDRAEAISILGALLREPDVDPCVEPAPYQFRHMYERSVGSLNAVCASRVSDDETKRIANELAQLSTDPDKDIRWAAVVALDAFEREPAAPALKRFLRDTFTIPGAPPEERRPIAAVAERALFQRAQKAPAAPTKGVP